jgi:hypothetical protein
MGSAMSENVSVPARTDDRIRLRRRRRKPWWRQRRVRRGLLIGLGVLAAAAILDGAWAANLVVRGLTQVRHQLEAAAGDLMAGRIDQAATRFGLAREFADEAAELTVHPAAALADALPWIGDDVDAIQTMAHAVSRIADSGASLVRAARAAGWDGDLPGRKAGSIPLEPFRAAGPSLDRAASQLGEAGRMLSTLEPADLFGPVSEAAVEVRGAVRERAGWLRAAADAADLVPGFLGGERPRRYVLALQNLSAPRGTGGFLGLYGVLEADRGHLRLVRLDHVQELGTVPPIDATREVVARYERFGGVTHPIAANYSPDFPTSARVILDMWGKATGGRLDGVVAADPVLASRFLRGTGPVASSAWEEPITARNVSPILHRDTFLLTSGESNRVQEALARDIWRHVLGAPLSIPAMSEAVAGGAEERHLQVYSREEEEQAILRDLGVSGDADLGTNPLFVVWQDAVASRAGFYAEKITRHEVRLERDGSATVTTEVTLRNEAPAGPPSVLLGSGTEGVPVGYFGALVNVYLPERAEGIDISAEPAGVSLELVEHEFGRPVAMELVGAPSGGTTTMAVTYRTPQASRRVGSGFEYRIDFLPQAALRPAPLSLVIRLPEGAEITAVPPGLRAGPDGISFEGAPTEPHSFWVRYRVES